MAILSENRIVRFILPVITLLLLLICVPAQAYDPFRVSLLVYQDGDFSEPFAGKITITEQPIPFYVEITNVSKNRANLWARSGKAGAYSSVSLEIRDDKGRKTIVKKKMDSFSSRERKSVKLLPGESKRLDMLIDPKEWKNVPKLEPGKIKHFKVRAIYDNYGKKIYSEYYNVTLDGR